MHTLSFHKFSPGGNTTILVTDGTIVACNRASVAAALMAPLHLQAEQVGFVTYGTPHSLPRLDMMGGEFCVNATRSLAALLAQQGQLTPRPDGTFTGMVSVSGADAPLEVVVSTIPACGCGNVTPPHPASPLHAAVCLPLEKAPRIAALAHWLHRVDLPGITHLLLDSAHFPFPADPATTARDLRAAHGLTHADAVGCIWYTRHADILAIDPVVWVRDTDSTHHETACGSGTLALALHVHGPGPTPATVAIRQPSGAHITVSLTTGQDGTALAWIGGPVQLIARGETYVPRP